MNVLGGSLACESYEKTNKQNKEKSNKELKERKKEKMVFAGIGSYLCCCCCFSSCSLKALFSSEIPTVVNSRLSFRAHC